MMFWIDWITTVPEEKWNGHEIIVYQTTESSKETHKQDQVSDLEETIKASYLLKLVTK
jgi:hypothetical protein